MTDATILNRESNTITIASFWENFLLDKYFFDPPYQRKSVWSDEKQSFFINSILRNFPMPPIFLHQKIDDQTGKTKYDVIDGKQRLTSLVKFIKNEIPASDELDNAQSGEPKLSGIFFKDLDLPELTEYKKRFWRYAIPIEYIDTPSIGIIDDIFDRLNRNGEPLRAQELRNSSYYDSKLLELIGSLRALPFWKERLKFTDLNRMEDIEFLSELAFVILEGGPLHANQATLDEMYEKYTGDNQDFTDLVENFKEYTNFLEELDIDYERYRISGVSHLYGLWCLAKFCVDTNIHADTVRRQIIDFYELLRSNDNSNSDVEAYKKSMSSRTKDKGQRIKRVNALKSFLGLS